MQKQQNDRYSCAAVPTRAAPIYMPACVIPMEEESESKRRSMNPSIPPVESKATHPRPPCYVLAVSLKRYRTDWPSRCIVLWAALAAFHGGIVRRPAASPVFGFCRKWPCVGSFRSEREKDHPPYAQHGTKTVKVKWECETESWGTVETLDRLDRSSSQHSPYSLNPFPTLPNESLCCFGTLDAMRAKVPLNNAINWPTERLACGVGRWIP
jgi:hypothetical protein